MDRFGSINLLSHPCPHPPAVPSTLYLSYRTCGVAPGGAGRRRWRPPCTVLLSYGFYGVAPGGAERVPGAGGAARRRIRGGRQHRLARRGRHPPRRGGTPPPRRVAAAPQAATAPQAAPWACSRRVGGPCCMQQGRAACSWSLLQQGPPTCSLQQVTPEAGPPHLPGAQLGRGGGAPPWLPAQQRAGVGPPWSGRAGNSGSALHPGTPRPLGGVTNHARRQWS